MMAGSSNKPLSERLAERRNEQLDELEKSTKSLLSEHATDLQQLLNDARHTTENAIRAYSEHLSARLFEVETRQTRQIQNLEHRLASAASQAERLSRVGGLRSWMRPLAITVAVMMAVGSVTMGGLRLMDGVITSRTEQLAELRRQIARAEGLPRLPAGVEIRAVEGHTYLIGIDPDTVWRGTTDSGQTPVIRLTRTE